MIDDAADAFISFGKDGRIVDWNREAEETFGYSAGDVRGKGIVDTIIPSRLVADGLTVAKFLKNDDDDNATRFEMMAMRKDGTEFAAEFTLTTVAWGDGRLHAVFVHDISEKKTLQGMAALQLDVTEILASSGSIESVVPDILAAVCARLNWQTGHFWSFEKGEVQLSLCGYWYTDPLSASDMLSDAKTRTFALDEGLPGAVWRRGEAIWVSDAGLIDWMPRRQIAVRAGFHAAAAFPVVAGSRVVAVMEFFSHQVLEETAFASSAMMDIGRRLGLAFLRREATTSLEMTRAMFESLIEDSPLAIVVLDLDGRMKFWNPPAAKAFGNSAWPSKGSILPLVPAAQQGDFARLVRSVGNGAAGKSFDIAQNLDVAGAERRVVWLTPLPELGGRRPASVIGIVIDPSERARLEEDLRQALHRAGSTDRAKDAFLAKVNHEIRTPLTAIAGYSELILISSNIDAEERVKLGNVVRRNVAALTHVIEELLSLSLAEADAAPIRGERVSLTNLVAEVTGRTRPRAVEKGLWFHVTIAPETPTTLVVDRVKVLQILEHLLSNSLKFTTSGGIDIEVGSVFHAGREGISFTVRDTGIGIGPEAHEHIFEAFAHAGYDYMTRRYDGIGLGLTIARRWAASMGGALTLLDSRPGEGATFCLVLPLELL